MRSKPGAKVGNYRTAVGHPARECRFDEHADPLPSRRMLLPMPVSPCVACPTHQTFFTAEVFSDVFRNDLKDGPRCRPITTRYRAGQIAHRSEQTAMFLIHIRYSQSVGLAPAGCFYGGIHAADCSKR